MSIFRVEHIDRIAQLIMDDPRRRINVLDVEAIADLERALDELEGAPALAGVVLRSGKSGSFIAGADVATIAAITDRAQVLEIVRRAHAAFGTNELGLEGALGSIPHERLNVNGGAIALGHPVGSSGARLLLTLLMEMRRRNLRLGIASLCVGGGQGAAFVLERD